MTRLLFCVAVVSGCVRGGSSAIPGITLRRPDAATTVETEDGGTGPVGPPRCEQVGLSSVSRYGSTATPLPDGRVLLVGSTTHDAEGPFSPVVESFDPRTREVTMLAPLHVGRAKHAATLLADGRVLVVGGMSDESDDFSRSAEIFDPIANRWTVAGSIPEGAIVQALGLLADGRAVLVGGDAMIKARKLAQTVVFDPRTLQWSRWPDAPLTRAGTLVPLADGRFLFAGDASGWSGDEPSTVDVLDPRGPSWSTRPSPLRGGIVHQAVRVSGTEVAFFGREATDGGLEVRIALADGSGGDPQELPLPTGTASWESGGAVDGQLYAMARSKLARWERGRRAWDVSATFAADECATTVALPHVTGSRGRLLFAGNCGAAGTSQGALELCEL